MAQWCLLHLAQSDRARDGGPLFRPKGPCLPPPTGSPHPNHHGWPWYRHRTVPGILAGEGVHEKRVTQESAQSAKQHSGIYHL